jgi:phospholipase/lecithinase/hemolysin
LIKLGAKTIVVPGTFPNGCVPKFLVSFPSKNPSDYNQQGCLKWANKFAKYHNGALKNKLQELRINNPGVTLIYADYYGATQNFIKNPRKYGNVSLVPFFLTGKFSSINIFLY